MGEVRIGTAKQNAIKQVLQLASPESYKSMLLHVSVCGGERRSSLTDTVLNWKHLWPGSAAPESQVPNALEELARKAGAAAAEKLVPKGLTTLGFKTLPHMSGHVPSSPSSG